MIEGGGPLPGTAPLTIEGDITSKWSRASTVPAQADRRLGRPAAAALASRLIGPEKYDASVAPNRKHLAKIIGAVDKRLPSAPETTAHRRPIGRVGRGRKL